MIQTYKVTATVAGADGSATGSGTSTQVVNGRLLAVYIDYTTQPSTTDVTIATVGKSPAPARTLLTVASANADGWFYPRVALQDTSGAALVYADGGEPLVDVQPVDDHVVVTVAEGNAGAVDVYLQVER